MNEQVKTPAIVTPTVNSNPHANVYMTQLTALNRRTERDAHFFGSVKLEGIWYQTSTWINVVNNVQNLSTSFTKMDEAQAAKAEIRQAEFEANRAARANPLKAPEVASEESKAPEQQKLSLEQCQAASIGSDNPLHPEFKTAAVDDDIPF